MLTHGLQDASGSTGRQGCDVEMQCTHTHTHAHAHAHAVAPRRQARAHRPLFFFPLQSWAVPLHASLGKWRQTIIFELHCFVSPSLQRAINSAQELPPVLAGPDCDRALGGACPRPCSAATGAGAPHARPAIGVLASRIGQGLSTAKRQWVLGKGREQWVLRLVGKHGDACMRAACADMDVLLLF